MLSQLLCVMDTLPSATHDLFLNQEHGALSAILSLWPSLYTLIGDPRMVGSSTTNTSIYTHVLTALCAHSVNLLFNGTEETFEDRIRWLEHNLFTHVLSTSFAVRYLISDWWVYLSRRWSSGTVLQHSRLLLQVAIALPRDHHVENEITALINRMMTETRDVDKRVFMKELSQMARKRPDVVVVMTRLRIVSLSDSVLGLIAHQDASAAAEAEPSGVASKADTPRTATSIESRANILSHPYSPVERSKRQQTFLQPLSGAVEVLQLKSKEAPQFDTHTNNEVQACTPIEEAKKELFCQLCRLSGYVMDVIPPEMLLKAKIQSHIARLYRRVLVDTDWLVWHYAVEAFREFASYTHYETLVPLLLPDESRSNVVDFINNTPFALPPTSHATHSNSPLQSIYTIDTPTDTNSQTSHHTHPRSGRTHKIATFATIRDRFVECLDIENARHEARLLPQPLQLPLPPQSDLEDDACPSDVPSVTTPNSAESKEQRKSMERETRNTKRARVDKHLSPKSPMLIDDDDDTTDTDEALLDLDEALQHLNQGLKKLKRTLSPNLRITPARKTQLVEVAQSLLTLCSGMNTK
ncbi:hypothetical protein SARC_04406 [Sphaeroforma arctica JP610]|uniref:Uncharacterized protein n=1 Tax=Sphaeroforma arctica JP610 TaxID=667725 RepID=A0A0L0G387_9EUKA|nr:hypothetical protein SARC_04406 [Sphaeroforma arctica JP610]KNC83334.1 hypothetical protein SARC_04406 [Sphaeroforma arctica JP610]|eukprot:XP_014157236.1 hypothetical protein SARC_04406 [Sphaeroforma arctica JP610]